MNIRIYSLLGVGGAALNLFWWKISVLIAGFAICEAIDQFLLKKRMRKRVIEAVDYELLEWETEKDDPTSESRDSNP